MSESSLPFAVATFPTRAARLSLTRRTSARDVSLAIIRKMVEFYRASSVFQSASSGELYP